MSSSINGGLKEKDKANKKALNNLINRENKYKDKYQKNNIQKKRMIKSTSVERKKASNQKESLLKNKNKSNTNKFYRYYPKKSQSMGNFTNNNKLKKLYMPLGPYSNMFNGKGGFCTKLSYNIFLHDLYNHNNNQIQDNYLNQFINKKNVNNNKASKKVKNTINQTNNLSTIKNNNKSNTGNKNRYIFNYKNFINKSQEKQKSNSNKKGKQPEKKKNLKIQKPKINENDTTSEIIKIKNNQKKKNLENLKLNIKPITKNQNIEIKNDNFLIKGIEDFNKNYIHNFNEKNNKICENETFSFNKIMPNSTKSTGPVLMKESNEQFSMNNSRMKTFNNLCQIDNVLLNYSPSFKNANDNNINSKTSLTNFSICSSQAEYSLVKDSHPKIDINDNENKNLLININQNSKFSPKMNIIQEINYTDKADNEPKIENNNKNKKETKITRNSDRFRKNNIRKEILENNDITSNEKDNK